MGQGQFSLDSVAATPSGGKGQFSLADAGHGASGSWEPESLPEKVWRIANTPLIPASAGDSKPLRAMAATGTMGLSLLPSENEARTIATGPPTPFDQAHPILGAIKHGVAGAWADTQQTARSFTSPLGLATLGLGKVAEAPGAVGKVAQAVQGLAGAGFGAQGGVQTAKGISDMANNGVSPENLQQTLQGMGQAALGGAGSLHALNEAVPSITRGGAGMKIIKQSALGDVPVLDRSKSFALTKELADNAEKGAPPLPKPLQAHYDQEQALGKMTPERIQQMGITPEQAQYSFRDLHNQQVLINNALYIDHSVPASIAPQVQKISGLMGEELQKTADANGFGDDWRRQADEVRHGYDLIRAGKKYGPAVGGLIGAALGAALPESGGGLGELPKVAQAAAPIVSGIGGSILGVKVGKSMIGGTAEAVARRNAGPPRLSTMPPTPEAYQRTVVAQAMADAKEGKITPGEMERRIARAGGSNRTKPLPPPP